MNEWDDVGLHKYTIVCQKCNQTVIMVQNGEELSESCLEQVVLETHVKNKYDAYLQGVINVELVQNPECI